MVTARTSDRYIQQCNSGESARCQPIFSGSKRLAGVRLFVQCPSAGIFLCETSFGVSEQSLDSKFHDSLKPVLTWANFLREPSWKYSAKLVGS